MVINSPRHSTTTAPQSLCLECQTGNRNIDQFLVLNPSPGTLGKAEPEPIRMSWTRQGLGEQAGLDQASTDDASETPSV
jgi:hypothetical protein